MILRSEGWSSDVARVLERAHRRETAERSNAEDDLADDGVMQAATQLYLTVLLKTVQKEEKHQRDEYDDENKQ